MNGDISHEGDERLRVIGHAKLGLDGGKGGGGQPLSQGLLRRATLTISQKLRRGRGNHESHRVYDSKLFDRLFVELLGEVDEHADRIEGLYHVLSESSLTKGHGDIEVGPALFFLSFTSYCYLPHNRSNYGNYVDSTRSC